MNTIVKIILRPMHLLGVAALLLAAAPVAAQNIYKCTKAGQVVYTDQPCPGQTGQLLHKADDAEVIDQYLRLGQDHLALQYADAHHLDALYQERLAAYQKTQEEKADRQANEKIAAQQEQQQAQQQAIAEAATNRERLRDENESLRQENDNYRGQLADSNYNAPPAYWGGQPSYGYGYG
ncbi:MAG: DUF4124 domain-containing protein, partial [Rhodanobacter sp.]